MFGRAIKRSFADNRWPSSAALPPAFLLPLRSRSFNSTAPIVEDVLISQAQEDSSLASVRSRTSTETHSEIQTGTGSRLPHPGLTMQHSSQPLVDESIVKLLPLLRAQGSHYITAHIHARPYLLTAGDTLRLPFHMPGVVPGDVLRLTRASNIGSRDYTLRGAPYIDERLFECRARVMGVEAEPMRIEEKTKRRQRHVKTVRSKHKFTVLKIAELNIRSLAETDM